MKKITLFFALIGLFSCSKPCKDTVCLNGGACDDGKCICPTGYSGTNCEKYDPCVNTVCQNNGTCDNGSCSCPLAYTGKNCESELRKKYYGTYVGTITGNGTTQNIGFEVKQNSTGLLYLTWDTQYMLLTDVDKFDIPLQNIYSNGTATPIEGSGSFSGNQMSLSFVATSNGKTSVISFTGTK